ncbi:MAG: HAMP domain-containing protein [Rhodoferax sp.]|nr:HAMP domain-containing protein [Rhodoferax sp.]
MQRIFHSLVGHFALVTVLSFVLLMGGMVYGGRALIQTTLVDNVRAGVEQTSQILNLTISTYASAGDLATVEVFLQEMLDEASGSGVTYVVITDAQGKVLASTRDRSIALPAGIGQSDISAQVLDSGTLHIRNPLLLPGKAIGQVQFGFSVRNLLEGTRQAQRQLLMRTALIMAFMLALALALGARLARRLRRVMRASEAMIAGDYAQSVDVTGSDEIGVLASTFNHLAREVSQRIQEVTELNQTLEARVSLRTGELEDANQQLQSNLAQLQATRDQLVNAEKLAALGKLVAGVAHELNTPLGNALTVSTALAHKTEVMQAEFLGGQMRKSTLTTYLADLHDANALLGSSIARASELIVSFKNVAVDQTSEMRRTFCLHQLLAEIERTTRHQFKKYQVQLTMSVPPDLALDSYPGPLGQVIVNLYNNAFIHAFEGGTSGQIDVSASVMVHMRAVRLVFADNGKGIAPENLGKVFDPFFTTRLGQGGSGLGLSICYNIVRGVLGGEIAVASELGEGTRFILTLPLVAPEQDSGGTRFATVQA